MSHGPEWHFAERPTIEHLKHMGYGFVAPAEHTSLRDGENQVLFRTQLIEALMRINRIDLPSAKAAYGELAAIRDNEAWLKVLRGDYARKVNGLETRQTLRVIDFLEVGNNQFSVTHQLRVKAETTRKPDVVVYVNGIPLVVIEAKSPLNVKDKTGEAFEQIRQYEQDIPRLFFSNVFNVVTDGALVLYGATGSGSKYFAEWRDPWPMLETDFPDTLAKGLWCLLEPSRLLDLTAHYVVFEKTETGTIKKICRYQQFRAVNRIFERVIEGKHRQGLIWHTQGSGKSLTMVFAALKLKTHRTIQSDALTNPNILVLTDRVDLHSQISSTFVACGLPNPTSIESIKDLHALTTYRDGIFTRNADFKRAVDRAQNHGSDLWLADIGHLLRKTSHANITKAMADLDNLQIGVIDCLSGKKWTEFELPERAAFSREALSRKVASLASGSVRKGQAPDIHNALKGASANRARAERKAEQLRPEVNKLKATLAPGDVITPSMLMRHLNAEGISPERGKAWSLNSCKNLLRRLQGTEE